LSERAHDPARSAGPRRNAQWLPRSFRGDGATSLFRSRRPNPVRRQRRGPRLLRSGEGAKTLMRRPVGSAWTCARGHLRRERQGRAPPGLEFFALDRACERIRAKACRCYKKAPTSFRPRIPCWRRTPCTTAEAEVASSERRRRGPISEPSRIKSRALLEQPLESLTLL
jgi:hypothetical protein